MGHIHLKIMLVYIRILEFIEESMRYAASYLNDLNVPVLVIRFVSWNVPYITEPASKL